MLQMRQLFLYFFLLTYCFLDVSLPLSNSAVVVVAVFFAGVSYVYQFAFIYFHSSSSSPCWASANLFPIPTYTHVLHEYSHVRSFLYGIFLQISLIHGTPWSWAETWPTNIFKNISSWISLNTQRDFILAPLIIHIAPIGRSRYLYILWIFLVSQVFLSSNRAPALQLLTSRNDAFPFSVFEMFEISFPIVSEILRILSVFL